MSAEKIVDLVHDEQTPPETVALLQESLERALELIFHADTGLEVTLEIASAERVCELNRELRGKDSATDVLSFPEFFEEQMDGGKDEGYSPFSRWFIEEAARLGAALPAPAEGQVPPVLFLGEIALDLEFSLNWARENGAEESEHLRLLVVHSLLHLAGLDHLEDESADKMEGLETAILKKM